MFDAWPPLSGIQTSTPPTSSYCHPSSGRRSYSATVIRSAPGTISAQGAWAFGDSE